jgi:hypothetical protein
VGRTVHGRRTPGRVDVGRGIEVDQVDGIGQQGTIADTE